MKTLFEKGLAVLILFVSLATLAVPARPAYAWGDAIPAAILKQTLEKIQHQIDGVLLATLKSTAINVLNTKVMQMVAGTSAKDSLIITNWKQYLYQEPAEQTKYAYDTTFKSITLQGRSTGFVPSTGGLSYESKISSYADLHLGNSASLSGNTARLSELSGDPIASVSNGNFRVLSEMYASGSDPIGYSLRAERFLMEESAKNQQEAQVKAMASGYKGVTDKYGNTILPGSTISQMVSNTQDMSNKIIAASQNPSELVGGVIASLANRMITSAIQNGLGDIQSKILREVSSVDNQIMDRVGTVKQSLGRGAIFTPELTQQLTGSAKTSGQGAAVPKGV